MSPVTSFWIVDLDHNMAVNVGCALVSLTKSRVGGVPLGRAEKPARYKYENISACSQPRNLNSHQPNHYQQVCNIHSLPRASIQLQDAYQPSLHSGRLLPAVGASAHLGIAMYQDNRRLSDPDRGHVRDLDQLRNVQHQHGHRVVVVQDPREPGLPGQHAHHVQRKQLLVGKVQKTNSHCQRIVTLPNLNQKASIDSIDAE
ncbi:hypothetical protein VTK56DRAFT_2179 [Thermocarpiscus australiensis]